MSFGMRLKEIRKKLNLNQGQFAEKIDVTQSNLSRYEQEKQDPSLPTVIKILCEFNINSQWLLTDQGEMFTNKVGEKKQTRRQEVEDFIFREAFPDVHRMWEENQQLLEKPSGNGCELCDILHSLDDERKTKLKGYAEALHMSKLLL